MPGRDSICPLGGTIGEVQVLANRVLPSEQRRSAFLVQSGDQVEVISYDQYMQRKNPT
jgi:hypothetical protein